MSCGIPPAAARTPLPPLERSSAEGMSEQGAFIVGIAQRLRAAEVLSVRFCGLFGAEALINNKPLCVLRLPVGAGSIGLASMCAAAVCLASCMVP